MRALICLLFVSLLSGCTAFTAKHSRTLLMDQATGEFRECDVKMTRTNKAYEDYEACIRAYQEQGYTIWSQY